MFKNRIVLVVASLILVLISACTTPAPEATEEGEWRCIPLPKTFQETDLTGTWHSTYRSLVTDTIILHDDGTYQQIYVDKQTGYEFTSSWNDWYLERRPSGGLYLHLEGMHYCLGITEVCRREGGGGGSWPYYDVCEDRLVEDMGSEVILVVQGGEGSRHPVAASAPKGIVLRHLRHNPDGSDDIFVLQE